MFQDQNSSLSSLNEGERRELKKTNLKLSIQKANIITSGLITSWLIDGETMETERDYFLGLQTHCGW